MGPLVHYELTLQWAQEAGLADVAEQIARADVLVDREFRATTSLKNLTMHFAPWSYFWVWRYRRQAVREDSAVALGRALHCAQDSVAHGVLGLAHLRFDAGLGRNPDDWRAAPERIRERIYERSMDLLHAFRKRG
ncbi:MAG: hypothetical protein LLG08_09240 [Actinomycetia bacterium]|nr:hypothetical protein [Actinomycetes bacterium]